MKKRSTLLSWITWIAIVFLICLLLFSILILWGRIFAANMPNSWITRLWRSVRSNCIAQSFMMCLRNCPLYEACKAFAYDSEGKLEPLSYLLGLMGCVSFAAGAVNEVKSTRSFGMLMRDVIHYNFPFHAIIQIFLYSLFAVIGAYACLKNIGLVAGVCLLGVFLCFVYSLTMTFFLFFSHEAKEFLVTCYMKGVLNKEAKRIKKVRRKLPANGVSDDTRDQWLRVAGICTLDYAKYIGQQWIKGSILQVHRDSPKSKEGFLIELLICGITEDPSWLKPRTLYSAKPSGLLMAKDFDQMFPSSKDYEPDGAKHVLFTKSLSYMKEPIHSVAGELEQDIRRCSQVWEQLLSEIEDPKKQAQLVYIILAEASTRPCQIFTIMSMGLLSYLGISRCEYATPNNKETVQKKIASLFDLKLFADGLVPEEKACIPQSFSDRWSEIVYLSAGVIQWIHALGLVGDNVETGVVYNLLREVQKGMSETGFLQLSHDREKYIVLSFLLFAFDNPDAYRELSAYIVYDLETKMYQEFF